MAHRVIGAVLAASLLALGIYATYRVVRHFFFPLHGHAATCSDPPLWHAIPAHPIVAFGDSISYGYSSALANLYTRPCPCPS